MTIFVILILAVLWVAVLAPPVIRSRREHRRSDSIGDFNYQLGVLGKANGQPSKRRTPRAASLSGPMRVAPIGPAYTPPTRRPRVASPGRAKAPAQMTPAQMTPAQRRRRDVLLALGAVVIVTFLLALVAGSMLLWSVQLLADALIVTYIVLLVQMQRRLAERQTKVRYLSHPAAPQLVGLRRTASSSARPRGQPLRRDRIGRSYRSGDPRREARSA